MLYVRGQYVQWIKTMEGKEERECWGQGLLFYIIREGSYKKMTFVQRHKGCEGTSFTDIMERVLRVEVAKYAKPLSLGHASKVQGYCSWS